MENDHARAEAAEKKNGRVDQILGWGGAFATTVLVALFIQKSDGNGAVETLALLGVAVLGAMLVAVAIAGLFYKAPPRHRLHVLFSRRSNLVFSAALGIFLIAVSLVAIDAEDSDFNQGPGEHDRTPRLYGDRGNDRSSDSGQFALRNLAIGTGPDSTRLTVSVVNKSKAPLVLNEAGVSFGHASDAKCGSRGERFVLAGTVEVDGSGRADASLLASEGPMAGFRVDARGYYLDRCNNMTGLSLDFPITLALDPLETASLTVDVAADVKVSRTGQGGRASRIFIPGAESEASAFVEMTVGYETEEAADSQWASICRRGSAEKNDRSSCSLF